MSVDLPAEWAKEQKVPTSVVTIKGVGGQPVAQLNITGTYTVDTTYPYKTTSVTS